MNEYHIGTPVNEALIGSLRIGDVVYLTGTIFTMRDAAHKRAIEWGEMNKETPVDLKDSIVFHCGPIVRKEGGSWNIISMGPTTSHRMSPLTPTLLEKFGVKAIIGKGGMDETVAASMKEKKAIYLSMTGGSAIVASQCVKEVKGVYWEDLGMPEALWVIEVENLGPLVVSIDTEGNNMYENIAQIARLNAERLI